MTDNSGIEYIGPEPGKWHEINSRADEIFSMTENNRDEQGRYESEHGIEPADVLNAMDPIEPYTTAELAATVGAPRRTVLNYLDKLEEQGRIRKKKPEPKRVIWIRRSEEV